MTEPAGFDREPPADRPAGVDRPRRVELFRSVDVAAFAATLCHRLRGAGIEIGPVEANRLAAALAVDRPRDVGTLYWTARVSLLHHRADIDAFDRVFDAVFGGLGLPIARWERDEGRAMVRTEGSVVRRSVPTDGLTALSARVTATRPEITDDEPDDTDPDEDTALPELLPADLEEVADRPFDQLDAEQLDRIGRWLAAAVVDLPERRSRRRRSAVAGSIDLRRTLARSRSTGEVMTLARRRPRTEPRPLVMVADVSGSMESFTRIYLHLLRAFATRPEIATFEAFVFATDLHRITPALRQRDAGDVVDRLTAETTDRFGGTRIATNLGRLLTGTRWSNAVRGATVVVVSDGWDADPSEELGRRMARLARMANRIVWVNPRAGDEAWRPEVAGMAAALPHVDELCSGHSLRAMARVIAALGHGR